VIIRVIETEFGDSELTTSIQPPHHAQEMYDIMEWVVQSVGRDGIPPYEVVAQAPEATWPEWALGFCVRSVRNCR
jgi:hypothetical protein